MEDRILLDECVRGSIYETVGRFWIGVFAGPGFIGPISKLGACFLTTELHCDQGGDCEPVLQVGHVPNTIPLDMRSGELLDFLLEFEKDIQNAV